MNILTHKNNKLKRTKIDHLLINAIVYGQMGHIILYIYLYVMSVVDLGFLPGEANIFLVNFLNSIFSI